MLARMSTLWRKRTGTPVALARVLGLPAFDCKAFTNRPSRPLRFSACSQVSPSRSFSRSTRGRRSQSADELRAEKEWKVEILEEHLSYMRAEVRSIEDRIKLIKKGKGADGPIIEVRMDDDWQAAEAARVEKLRRSRGQECDYALTYSENMPLIKDVTCVAIGEGGYIALLEDGSAHYDHLPPEVEHKIKFRLQDDPVTLVSIGPSIGGFLEKTEAQYHLQGERWNEYHNLPNDVIKVVIIDARHEVLLTKLVYFVLGPPGTFYAQFDNGKAAWGQVSSRVEELFLSKEVVCAWLGEKGSYFVGWEEEGVYKTEHQHLPHEMMRRYAVDAVRQGL